MIEFINISKSKFIYYFSDKLTSSDVDDAFLQYHMVNTQTTDFNICVRFFRQLSHCIFQLVLF